MENKKALFLISITLILVGYGIALHDFAHQVWELKGTVISLEGGYVGFLILLIGLLILIYHYFPQRSHNMGALGEVMINEDEKSNK